MGRIGFSWNEVSCEQWQSSLAVAGSVALQQDWSYGQAICEQGHEIHRACLTRDGRIIAVAQIAERRLFGPLRIALLMRGPTWINDYAEAYEAMFLEQIRHKLAGAVLLWTPDRIAQPATRHRLSGYRRVLTGYSTVLVDLKPDLVAIKAQLNGKWRNLLRSSERSEIVIKAVKGGKLHEWLVSANESYRQKIGYNGPSPDFIKSLGYFSNPNGRQVWLAMVNDKPIAGVIMQKHGRMGTYYAGCTSPQGRQLRAHHRLLWHATEQLKASGVITLDLGGIDTEKAPGVARFKLGMGGAPVTLAGTYLIPPKFGNAYQKGPQLPAALQEKLRHDKAA